MRYLQWNILIFLGSGSPSYVIWCILRPQCMFTQKLTCVLPFVVGNCHSVFILDTCTLRLSIIRFNCQFPMVILFYMHYQVFILKNFRKRWKNRSSGERYDSGASDYFQNIFKFTGKTKRKYLFYILNAIRFPVVEIAQLASLWCDNLYSSNIHTLSVFIKQLTVLGKHLFLFFVGHFCK